MRILSARNAILNSTMPIVSLDQELSTNNKRKSVDYGIRGRSIHKQDRINIDNQQDIDAYNELKSLYEKALSENFSLKSESYNESSLSTVKLEKDNSLKFSFAKEIDELHETLAEALQSIKSLKEYQKELINNKIQAKKELDEQKNLYSFAKDNMVSLLQGKLNNTVDMLKTIYRDNKNLESILEKEEKNKHNFQGQSAALEEKIKVIEGRNKDLLTASALTSQIAAALSRQETLNKKIEKYEAYIQSKMKKS